MWAANKKFRKPDDLVFANRHGKALDRHNFLHRHLKPAAEKLGLPSTLDFGASGRCTPASCVATARVLRSPLTTWAMQAGRAASLWMSIQRPGWDQRVDAVSRVVEAVFAESGEDEKIDVPLKDLPLSGTVVEWEPFLEPQADGVARNQSKVFDFDGRGERIRTSDPLVPNWKCPLVSATCESQSWCFNRVSSCGSSA
jgi:hypothetical protein